MKTAKLSVIIGGTMLGVWLLAWPVHAQLGLGCQCVSDPPVEAATATIAASVTTGGGAGIVGAQATYLNQLMQLMNSGILNAQTFDSTFTGWIDPADYAAALEQRITPKVLSTYANALKVVQAQASNFGAEDDLRAALEACNARATAQKSVLLAIQCGNEIGLANFQQTQMDRQLKMTQIVIDAVDHGQQINEDAQYGAANEATFTGASQH